ncbi:MAG: RNA polymerase sigma factor [Planctomycetota bacterium]
MSVVAIDAEAMRELVAGAQQGSRQAAERLIREHEGWVRSAIYGVTGRAELVDDIAQQVWTRAWQGLPGLADGRQLRSWLYTIARNTAIDYSMAHRRVQAAAVPLQHAAATPDRRDRGPDGTVAADELQKTLLQAVQSLPALYREPFVLRHLENWSYAEIASVLGLSVETIETRLTRARRLLREMLRGKIDL